MKIYNTLTKRKEEFVPMDAGKVKMYACGITVSGDAHIGHAYQALIYDIMRKYLEKKGYIERVPDANDRRRVIVWITVEGKERAQEKGDASAKALAKQLEALGESDASELVRILNKAYSITYDQDDGTGTPPVDPNEYSEGSYAPVSTEYPLTKASNTQTGWATSSGGPAVTSVKMDENQTLYPVWTPAG